MGKEGKKIQKDQKDHCADHGMDWMQSTGTNRFSEEEELLNLSPKVE